MKIKKFKDLYELKDEKAFKRTEKYIEVFHEICENLNITFEKWKNDESWSYAPETHDLVKAILEECEGKISDSKYNELLDKINKINNEEI